MQYWNNPLGNRKKQKQKRNLHLLYFKANRGGGASRRIILVLHSLSLLLRPVWPRPFSLVWAGSTKRFGARESGSGWSQTIVRVARQIGSGFCFARTNSYNKKTKQTSHFCACVRKVRVLQSVMDNCERKFMKLKVNTHIYTFMQSHKEHEKEQKWMLFFLGSPRIV